MSVTCHLTDPLPEIPIPEMNVGSLGSRRLVKCEIVHIVDQKFPTAIPIAFSASANVANCAVMSLCDQSGDSQDLSRGSSVIFNSAGAIAHRRFMSAFGPKQTSLLRRTCPLSGVKRTSVDALQMSAFDPKRT